MTARLTTARSRAARSARRELADGIVPKRRRRSQPFRLTGRDGELLSFVAAHRFVLAAHAQKWLDTSPAFAYRRLAGLVDAGLLSYHRIFHAQPGCFVITNGGLAVIDSRLPRPAIDLRSYGHDIGLVWVWLAARDERFGPFERLVSEREMRSQDEREAASSANRFGVPVEGYDRSGRQRVHYPDVLIVGPDARRVAVELELSVKGRRRLERILVGYRGEPLIRRVVYLTNSGVVARTLRSVVQEVGASQLIEIQALPLASARDRERPWAWPASAIKELRR